MKRRETDWGKLNHDQTKAFVYGDNPSPSFFAGMTKEIVEKNKSIILAELTKEYAEIQKEVKKERIYKIRSL